MSVTNCNEFLNRLEQWMDGNRSAEAQAHLHGCPRCRGIVEDLDSIYQTARSLDVIETNPPDYIWTTLRTQLENEGLINRESHGWVQGVLDWLGGVLSAVPRPALAGAYLVALIGISVALAGPGYRRFTWGGESTRPLSAQLDTAERNAMSAVYSDPDVTASLEKNLAIVDNYITLCEKSVQEDPESEIARDYLYNAYQQKANLLAQMSERGVGQ
jgi:hypothetical protein